jgi:hypothetical protein
MPAAASCSLAGGILRLLVANATDLTASTLTITNTGATRHQITAIDVALDWYEIKFDKKRDASAAAENTRPGAAAFTHTVSVLISTDDTGTHKSLIDLQDCCGVVSLAKLASGKWILLGLNYSKLDATYDSADMQVKYDFTSGANRADEAAGATVALSTENVNFGYMDVAPAAAATAIAAIVANTP